MYQLTHNGKLVFEGTEFQCFLKLQSSQSASASWAMKYEGWKVELKNN